MAKIRPELKYNKLSPDIELTNKNTGEIHAQQGNILVSKLTGKIKVDYKEYAYIDLESLRHILSKGITQVELALLITLSSNLLQDENICMQNNGEPHTTLSIAKLINNTHQATKKKINKLIKRDLLNYSIAKVKLRSQKVYRINPHFLKKGVYLNSLLAPLFNPIGEESPIKPDF